MFADRLRRAPEQGGDLRIAFALCDPEDHFALAAGEAMAPQAQIARGFGRRGLSGCGSDGQFGCQVAMCFKEIYKISFIVRRRRGAAVTSARELKGGYGCGGVSAECRRAIASGNAAIVWGE